MSAAARRAAVATRVGGRGATHLVENGSGSCRADMPIDYDGRRVAVKAGTLPSMRKMDFRPVIIREGHTPHALAIQTAPRPQGSSLERALAAVEHGGGWEGPKIVVADGCEPTAPEGWIVDASPPPCQGSSKTFLRLLRKAVEVCPGMQALTYLQDDVVLARNALSYISRVNIDDDLTLISWFAVWWHEAPATHPILGVRPTKRFRRSQAITMPRRTVDKILALDATKWRFRHECDCFFAFTLQRESFATHYPSLAQHMEGTNSACEHDRFGDRKAPSFPGEDFDVLSLSVTG